MAACQPAGGPVVRCRPCSTLPTGPACGPVVAVLSDAPAAVICPGRMSSSNPMIGGDYSHALEMNADNSWAGESSSRSVPLLRAARVPACPHRCSVALAAATPVRSGLVYVRWDHVAGPPDRRPSHVSWLAAPSWILAGVQGAAAGDESGSARDLPASSASVQVHAPSRVHEG